MEQEYQELRRNLRTRARPLSKRANAMVYAVERARADLSTGPKKSRVSLASHDPMQVAVYSGQVSV